MFGQAGSTSWLGLGSGSGLGLGFGLGLGLGLTRIRVRVNKDLEAEQVGGDARAQAGLGAEGGEEDLLVVDPAADPPVGGELAW